MKFLLDQGLKGDGVARIIQQVIAVAESDLNAGAAVTVTDRRLAIKRLPLFGGDALEASNDGANGS